MAPQATSLLGGGEQAIRSELRCARPVCVALKFVAVTFLDSIRVKGAIVNTPGGGNPDRVPFQRAGWRDREEDEQLFAEL